MKGGCGLKGFNLIKVQNQLSMESALQDIRECNEIGERFGLSLNDEEIRELMECRAKALKDTGRVEFGDGILPKLIYAFCDSPYIDEDNYESTLIGLQVKKSI